MSERTCERCGGWGKLLTASDKSPDSYIVCPDCHGTGKLSEREDGALEGK